MSLVFVVFNFIIKEKERKRASILRGGRTKDTHNYKDRSKSVMIQPKRKPQIKHTHKTFEVFGFSKPGERRFTTRDM